ncbi:MAG: rhomboid family intramembrane serine protease [Spirochaetes bacterium]|nr:rhomboid family intramembrane serine protease [Spirochaetota bacterium]
MSDSSFLRRPLRYSFFNATLFLIAANVLVFLVTMTARQTLGYIALRPAAVLQAGAWWQVFTYMFVHANFTHLFLNMLSLYLFGVQLERRMGSGEFLLYYLVSGVGAGLVTLLVNNATGQGMVYVVGASGAIFAVLLAFASFFPDTRIFIFGILPMRAPTAVLVFAGIEVFSMFTNFSAGVAHLTHLAGILFGYGLLVLRFRINPIRVFFRDR